MERLTYYDTDKEMVLSCHGEEAFKDALKILDKLCAYEDAEDQCRLIEFPVSIGQHVYYFQDEHHPKYYEGIVIGLQYSRGGNEYLQIQDLSTNEIVCFNAENLGKLVFTTRSEVGIKQEEIEADNAEDH